MLSLSRCGLFTDLSPASFILVFSRSGILIYFGIALGFKEVIGANFLGLALGRGIGFALGLVAFLAESIALLTGVRGLLRPFKFELSVILGFFAASRIFLSTAEPHVTAAKAPTDLASCAAIALLDLAEGTIFASPAV